MRVLLQRVSEANVKVEGEIQGEIKKGLLLLVGVCDEDTSEDLDWIVRKTLAMRIFPDQDGRMNRSVLDEQFDVLVISQFTLYASTKKGNRPSFIAAAQPGFAEEMYDKLIVALKEEVNVESGVFGADMKVNLVNDGPVTIWLDSKNKE